MLYFITINHFLEICKTRFLVCSSLTQYRPHIHSIQPFCSIHDLYAFMSIYWLISPCDDQFGICIVFFSKDGISRSNVFMLLSSEQPNMTFGILFLKINFFSFLRNKRSTSLTLNRESRIYGEEIKNDRPRICAANSGRPARRRGDPVWSPQGEQSFSSRNRQIPWMSSCRIFHMSESK